MNEIIVGVSRPKGWFEPFSWLIRLVTWSSYSHAYIKFYSEAYQRWIVFQASGLKVNFIGATMFDNNEIVGAEFAVPISDQTKTCTISQAFDICGSPYGTSQALGILWVLFMEIFGKKVKNPFYSTSSYVCSELVATILVELGYQLDPSSTTPQEVYDFLISKGFVPQPSVAA